MTRKDIAAEAVRNCPAVAEIAEFARRAPHLDFGLAYNRAVIAALLRAGTCSEPDARSRTTAPSRDEQPAPPPSTRSDVP